MKQFIMILSFLLACHIAAAQQKKENMNIIGSGGSMFSFYSYLKSGNYKKFVNSPSRAPKIFYFRKIHDGSFYRWYIGASIGYKRTEFNSLNPSSNEEEYVKLIFIEPGISLRNESLISKKTTFYFSLGMKYSINLNYSARTPSDSLRISSKTNNLTMFGGDFGFKTSINKRIMFGIGVGGDNSIGKLLKLEGKKYSVMDSYLTTSMEYLFRQNKKIRFNPN